MSKQRSFSMVFKKKVLKYVFEDECNPKSSYAAAENFNAAGHKISMQKIHKWISNRNMIISSSANDSKRLTGGERSPLLSETPKLEESLCMSIAEERKEDNRVSGSDIKTWALEVARSNGNDSFCAFDEWLDKFLQRNGFSFRRVTNSTPLTSEDLVTRAVSYIIFLQSRIPTIIPEKIILMDETTVYLKDPRRVTINESGNRHVILISTGFASMRVTVLFSFTVTDMSQEKSIVWDSCRAHTAATVKEHLRQRGITNIIVPGSLTPCVQAGDLGIFKSLKDKISPIISSWKNSDPVERTQGGNPRPPKKEIVCDWVIQAWRNVDQDVILNSIKTAGFGEQNNWMIYKHDVYGHEFKQAWMNYRELVDDNQVDNFAQENLQDESIIIQE